MRVLIVIRILWGKNMKTLKKNPIHHNFRVNTLNRSLLERIRNTFSLHTLGSKINAFNSTITEQAQSKENNALSIEAEIRQNQARSYASIIPPR